MNWFAQQRQEWIAETLRVFGFINRQHIMRKFGVSMPQASTDLREYQRLNPGAIVYETSLKVFMLAKEPAPRVVSASQKEG